MRFALVTAVYLTECSKTKLLYSDSKGGQVNDI